MIKAEIVKHGWDPEEVDVHALVDPTLSYPENRKNIANILQYKTKNRSVRNRVKEESYGLCMHLQERCESRYEKPACKEYVKEECHKEYGSPDVPAGWFSPKKPKKLKKQKSEPGSACGLGAFWINPYQRYCPPCKTEDGLRGRFLDVKGHCRTNRRVVA